MPFLSQTVFFFVGTLSVLLTPVILDNVILYAVHTFKKEEEESVHTTRLKLNKDVFSCLTVDDKEMYTPQEFKRTNSCLNAVYKEVYVQQEYKRFVT